MLHHYFKLARGPLSLLAPIRDLQDVVSVFIYGSHTFPHDFFRTTFKPARVSVSTLH